MSTKHRTFITTPSIIHDQDFVFKKKVFAKIAIFLIKMSESKIFFRLTQATNTYKHISRNIGATMTASIKLAHDKVFFIFSQKGLFKKKIALQSKTVIALNLYNDINELVYDRRLMMKVFSMTKCVKKTIFCKTCYILSNNVPIKYLGGLIQAPNMSKHISRNGGATIKASRKTANDKVF